MNHAQHTKRVEKLTALLEVGKAMASERNLDRLLQLILGEVTRVMEAERSSLFLVDRDRNELWSKIAQGLEVREIRIKIGMGISGYVAQTGKTVNIPDAYADPRFNQETDHRTGYRTRNILCAPMRNKHEEVIGVLQVLYQWPVLGLPLGVNFANLGNGTYLMMSTQVFRVESTS